jgi:hypothetical protein
MEKMQTGKEITINTGQKDDKIYVDGKYVGTSPYKTNLSYGSHNIKAERGSQTVTKNIEVTQNSELVYTMTFEKEPLKKYLDGGVNFLTLNAAYSVAPQTSFGFTYGQVKKFGWFVSAMTDLGFNMITKDWKNWSEILGSDTHTFTGESFGARLSLMAGFMFKISGAMSMRIGAGYGARVKCWKLDNNWYEKATNTAKGVDLSAGFQFDFKGVSISTDVVTTNFKIMEVKVGLGMNWNK